MRAIMASVQVNRKHTRNEDEVRQHIEELATKLAARLSAQYRWCDNRLEFSRTGASGYLLQKKGEIEIRIKLGMLLIPFKDIIERAINLYMDNTLED
jgi:putative polyhydroxyalkanoate system protein